VAVASVSTITSASALGWQDAVESGLERAAMTLRQITGLRIVEEKARVEDGKIIEYLVTMQVIFLLEDLDG
jgi:flavin-binding protein dodecin